MEARAMANRQCRGGLPASTFDGRAETLNRFTMGVVDVSKSVLDAIREGDWFFEPDEVDAGGFQATTAIPGTQQKLDVLAARARAGLPLWHERDRADYEESELD
jgi:hypothetical protein